MAEPYKWIRNQQEFEFAREYICRHVTDEAWEDIAYATKNIRREDTLNWVLAALETLDKRHQKLFTRLSNSVRQFRLRHTAPGRKQRSFTLPDATCKVLAELARKHEIRPAEIITELVTESSKVLKELEQKHRIELKAVKAKLEHERLRYKQRAAIQEEQIDELKRTLLMQVRQLVMWEQSMSEAKPPYDGDTQLIEALSQERVEALIKESDHRAEIGALVLLRPSPV